MNAMAGLIAYIICTFIVAGIVYWFKTSNPGKWDYKKGLTYFVIMEILAVPFAAVVAMI